MRKWIECDSTDDKDKTEESPPDDACECDGC